MEHPILFTLIIFTKLYSIQLHEVAFLLQMSSIMGHFGENRMDQ